MPRFKLDVDADPIEQSSTIIAASNGRCFGGGFWLTPTAQVDDGLLDIVISKGMSRVGVLTLLPKVMRGKHIGDPRVYFVQARRLTIESPTPLVVETDGELPYMNACRLEIELLPKRLAVFV